MTKKATNIARHPASRMTARPRAGAAAGTRMNTAIANDMMRAIGRPPVLVADEGDGHDARGRHADALEDAGRDHHLERGRPDRDQAPCHEHPEADVDRGLAPEPVGERAEEDLANPEPEKDGDDDVLDVVRADHAEVSPDRRERGQHRVDGKGDEGEEERDEGDELAGTKPSRGRRGRAAVVAAVHRSPRTRRHSPGHRSRRRGVRPRPPWRARMVLGPGRPGGSRAGRKLRVRPSPGRAARGTR